MVLTTYGLALIEFLLPQLQQVKKYIERDSKLFWCLYHNICIYIERERERERGLLLLLLLLFLFLERIMFD